jgi:hypothetical protein
MILQEVDDPQFTWKRMEVLDDYRAQVFKVVANLQDKESKLFLAFARYVILSQDEFHHLEKVKSKL